MPNPNTDSETNKFRCSIFLAKFYRKEKKKCLALNYPGTPASGSALICRRRGDESLGNTPYVVSYNQIRTFPGILTSANRHLC